VSSTRTVVALTPIVLVCSGVNALELELPEPGAAQSLILGVAARSKQAREKFARFSGTESAATNAPRFDCKPPEGAVKLATMIDPARPPDRRRRTPASARPPRARAQNM
jgi:hypothetical protein